MQLIGVADYIPLAMPVAILLTLARFALSASGGVRRLSRFHRRRGAPAQRMARFMGFGSRRHRIPGSRLAAALDTSLMGRRQASRDHGTVRVAAGWRRAAVCMG